MNDSKFKVLMKSSVNLVMKEVNNNVSLENLSESDRLSSRSKNLCEDNELIDLASILFYYWENKNFLGLRNCGQKVNTELIILCKKYEHRLSKPTKYIPVNPWQQMHDSLTMGQKRFFSNIIKCQISKLSRRTNYYCSENYFDSKNNKGLLNELIFNPDYNYSNLSNIGQKSQDELKRCFVNVRDLLELICASTYEKERTIALFKYYLKLNFGIGQVVIKEIFENYNFKNGLSLFKTIDILIRHELIFNKNERIIFENCINYWQDKQMKTLQEVADYCNISKERTRQIRNRLMDQLSYNFAFIKDFEKNSLNLYRTDFQSDLILITEEKISEINKKEVTSFNHLFINTIFSILLYKSHKLVGNVKSASINSDQLKNAQYYWHSTYLIKHELYNVLDFDAIVNDVNRRLSEIIEKDYSIHFKTYLLLFLKDVVTEDVLRVIPIIKHILFSEFKFLLEINDNIVFKRNAKIEVYEYAYKALEVLGKPSKVSDIYKKVFELNPAFHGSENSMRVAMLRKTDFITFGRTSTYGLKKWESNDIRGGTISDITEEFLNSHDHPMHISEITAYVNRYRNTTSKNIYLNLKMKENIRFTFFSGRKIGLKSKEYQNQDLVNGENTESEKGID